MKVREGSIFSVSPMLKKEGIVGLLARYYGKNMYFHCGCFFFQHPDLATRIDPELLRDLVPIKICQCTDTGFQDGSWSILMEIEEWDKKRSDWRMPSFKYIDSLNPQMAYIRTYDDITNSEFEQVVVRADQAQGYSDDGLEGFRSTEFKLNEIVADAKDLAYRNDWRPRK